MAVLGHAVLIDKAEPLSLGSSLSPELSGDDRSPAIVNVVRIGVQHSFSAVFRADRHFFEGIEICFPGHAARGAVLL